MRWVFLGISIFTGLMALTFIWLIAFYLHHYSLSWRLVPMAMVVAIWALATHNAFLRFRGVSAAQPIRSSVGLLKNRAALILVLFTCLIEGVWSWALIAKPAPHREDLIDLAFSGFVIFISVSIAYRSSFWADRVVFGAVAGAFALIVTRPASLAPSATFTVNVAHALMWTLAALVSLMVLTSRLVASHRRSS